MNGWCIGTIGMMVAAVLVLWVPRAMAVPPEAGEMADLRQWVAAKFEGVVIERPREPGLAVLANHGVVQLNARGGEPLRIGTAQYERGLYCHTESEVVVNLPGPGKAFSAVVGVDSRAGGGTIVFSVVVGGEERFRSDVMRGGEPGVEVVVDLGGADTFTLKIDSTGDGISCDQGDWANAKATLEDGDDLWLGDMPILPRPMAEPYSLNPPFSFMYGERPSAEFLPTWHVERAARVLDAQRTERTLTYTDAETGLEVRCVAIEYADAPNIEWTLFFRNGGAADTPIIESIQAIDTVFHRAPDAEFTLHRIKGDNCTPDSYEPLVETIGPNTSIRIANTGGRPTQISHPYFNLHTGREGVIVVVSWAGQWATQFTPDADYGLRVLAGQELTHFTLHPGEEVRTPLIVVQFYRGDWIRGQNLWRRWMVEHNLPRPGGTLVQPMASLCTGNYYPGLMSNAAQELEFINRYLDEGVYFGYWWQDAGWYPCDGVTWPKVGTWEVDPVRFPKGLREVSDYVHARGIGSIVWFEPERVHADTWLTNEHPEWVHGGAGGGLLDLGNPEARQWLTDHIDALLTEQGIDVYRQDFNIDPLPYWCAADAPDRQGITEIRHVTGYLAYWDELIRRHPSLLIDSCASGGRRNDLETLRRAVPLLRSDWYAGEAGQQGHTYGLALWLPFQGTGVISQKDAYWIRSSMVAEFTFGPDAAGLDVIDFKRFAGLVEDWRKLAPSFYGDFYPLTPYSLDEDVWMAWQYDCPERGGGAVQVFRRANCIYDSARLPLHGIEPKGTYTVVNLDTPDAPMTISAHELAADGLPVTMPNKPGAAIILYEKRAP
ncbi:MAG TPA: NPCBM/NEW2 domain-containing protein [Candidatus Hydrogenedentes bacterium]|nr:NPCBM/NEW2 domain-containing protein [Candidatus Hydrogenedentota bacterium]